MDASDLRIFEAVARLGGMNRAATELHTVQSNITARIRALEAELKISLFERHSRGVTLTAAGERLLPYAQQLGGLLVEARAAVADCREPNGRLRLGSMETTAMQRLPPLVRTFVEHNPRVDLFVRVATHSVLVDEVLAHRLDGAFLCGPVEHQDLFSVPVFNEELVVVAPPGTMSLEGALCHRDLRILVKPEGCAYRERFHQLIHRYNAHISSRIELETTDGILEGIKDGLGLTLLPRSVALRAGDRGNVALLPLPDGSRNANTVFAYRRKTVAPQPLKAFLAMLPQFARDQGGRCKEISEHSRATTASSQPAAMEAARSQYSIRNGKPSDPMPHRILRGKVASP